MGTNARSVHPSMPPLTFAGGERETEPACRRRVNDKGPGSTPGALVATVLDLRAVSG